MKNIAIIQLPPPLYTLKDPLYSNRNIIWPSYNAKSMLLCTDNNGFTIDVISQMHSTLGGDHYLKEKILDKKRDFVIFPAILDYNFNRSAYLAKKIKEESPKTKIIIAGPEVTKYNKDELKDFVFDSGQSHIFTPDILNFLISGSNGKEPDYFTLNRKRKIYMVSDFKELCMINKIPSPYLNNDIKNMFEYKIAAIESKRGCIGNCNYCRVFNYNLVPESYRKLEDIKKELFLFKKLQITTIKWLDYTFNYPKDWFLKICGIINEVNFPPDTSFEANLRSDYIDEQTVELLKKLRFSSIEIGLQTSSEKILNKINRPTNIKNWLEKVNLLKKAGLNFSIDIILGLPDEDINSFKNTINFLAEEELITNTGVLSLRVDPSSMLPEISKKKKIKYQKKAPHYILESPTFTFNDLQEGINYAKNMGAKINSDPYRNDYFPCFSTYFDDGENKTNSEFTKIPITKIKLNLDLEFTHSPAFENLLIQWSKKLAQSVLLWLTFEDPASKEKIIFNILNNLSRQNPYTIWNIALECQEPITANFINKIKSGINYLPTKFDYDSVFLAKNNNNEYLRNSERIFILLNNTQEQSYESENGIYIYRLFDSLPEKRHFDLNCEGIIYDFPSTIPQNDIIKILKEIKALNYKNKNILFKNLFLQTLYNYYFLNKSELYGYEENIIELKNNKLYNTIFNEALINGKFPDIRRAWFQA